MFLVLVVDFTGWREGSASHRLRNLHDYQTVAQLNVRKDVVVYLYPNPKIDSWVPLVFAVVLGSVAESCFPGSPPPPQVSLRIPAATGLDISLISIRWSHHHFSFQMKNPRPIQADPSSFPRLSTHAFSELRE